MNGWPARAEKQSFLDRTNGTTDNAIFFKLIDKVAPHA
jgi:hypothetical protein